jgi:hypothetical protein
MGEQHTRDHIDGHAGAVMRGDDRGRPVIVHAEPAE